MPISQNEYSSAKLSNYFFVPNRLTLDLILDKALDSTILNWNKSGSAAHFSVQRLQVARPSTSASCSRSLKNKFAAKHNLRDVTL